MNESIQKKLSRVRPPRVEITFDVETGGAIEKRELPFIVGIFADLSGDRDPDQALILPPLKERKMADIDRDNFNDIMKAIRPRVDLGKVLQNTPAVAALLATPNDRQIVFENINDFDPMQILSKLPALKSKYESRSLQSSLADNSGDVAAVVDELATHTDEQLSIALTAILHSPGFRQIEATWRGLAHLVFNTETNTMLKLKVFNATQSELSKDMEQAVEFDRSILFKLVHETAHGASGSLPYSLLVGGYEMGAGGADIAFLKKISAVAAAAHAPFIAAASSDIFGFNKLDKPGDQAAVYDNAELEAWREFRDLEESRYVALALPRFMLRLPYGHPAKRSSTPGGEITGYPKPDKQKFLWGNPAYALAERITNAFSLYHWPAAIRGEDGGGLVEGLPLYSYITASGGSELLSPVSDSANARMAFTLPCILAASRFAHYIKVIMRDKIDSFITRADVETFLNGWISSYVLLDDNATQSTKAAYPLRSASVVVNDVPGQPGSYRATLFLKPHFQLEELTTSIRLVVNFPG
ncbi:MAG: type VI secretion system contractile sheath large subunit [Duganella sp.]